MLQARSSRSIFNEIRALPSILQTEFQGQVTFCDSDDMSLRCLLFDVAPMAGPYQHASFRVAIDIPVKYPDEAPSVSCFPPPFHPNIDPTKSSDNVCVNVINHWVSHFGLLSLLHGILFLFYEPNFESPLNPYMPAFEDDITFEHCVHSSLFGGTICGIRYLPNPSWCKWARDNRVQPHNLPSTIYKPLESEPVLEQYPPETGGLISPADNFSRQRSSSSIFFRRSVSPLPGQFEDLFTEDSSRKSVISRIGPVSGTQLYSITLEHVIRRVDDSSNRPPWSNFVRYYFVDRVVFDTDLWMLRLIDDSNLLLMLDHDLAACQAIQRTTIDSWDPVNVPFDLAQFSSSFSYLAWEAPYTDTESERLNDLAQNVARSPALSSQSNHTHVSGSPDDCEVVSGQAASVISDQSEALDAVCRGTSSQTHVPVASLSNAGGIPVVDTLEEVTNMPLRISDPLVEVDDLIDRVPCDDTHSEVVVVDYPHQLPDSVVDGESESLNMDAINAQSEWLAARYLRLISPIFHYLRPRWRWPFYQTRWPPFLAPGHVVVVERRMTKLRTVWPDSYFHLLAELFHISERARTTETSLVLVDPLVSVSIGASKCTFLV